MSFGSIGEQDFFEITVPSGKGVVIVGVGQSEVQFVIGSDWFIFFFHAESVPVVLSFEFDSSENFFGFVTVGYLEEGPLVIEISVREINDSLVGGSSNNKFWSISGGQVEVYSYVFIMGIIVFSISGIFVVGDESNFNFFLGFAHLELVVIFPQKVPFEPERNSVFFNSFREFIESGSPFNGGVLLGGIGFYQVDSGGVIISI